MAGILSTATAEAMLCLAMCKPEIQACKALCTAKPRAKCKRQCNKSIVAFCRSNRKTCPPVTTTSSSTSSTTSTSTSTSSSSSSTTSTLSSIGGAFVDDAFVG
jgi:hypothetical protein